MNSSSNRNNLKRIKKIKKKSDIIQLFKAKKYLPVQSRFVSLDESGTNKALQSYLESKESSNNSKKKDRR